jgi:EAL domain-containing protein (putative c-di-GMP-specific phosphodiesterase class I)
MGLLNPDAFIPLAEQTGLIVPIGRWVLNEACVQYKKWRDLDLVPVATPLNAAVNVSAQQLIHGDFQQEVADVLERTGFPAHMLQLEITESVIMEAGDRAAEILREIKSLGVTLAIDDFGSGFSSLGYIKHFPIDTLKIDRVFVRHLPDDRNDAAIVRAILELATSLGLHVIAEGVEKTEQLDFLKGVGCQAAQGYLLGRPVESGELLSLIQDQGVQHKWYEMLKS